jgi:predicted signal transduction protein with EAL and GGDEF domain
VLTRITDLKMLKALAFAIAPSITKPIHTHDITGEVGVSIGGVTYPNDGETVEELLERADRAMYCAERAGHVSCALSDIYEQM